MRAPSIGGFIPSIVQPRTPQPPDPPTHGLCLIGNVGPKLSPMDLPVGCVVVSPAGLVARVAEHFKEEYVYTAKGKSTIKLRPKCKLQELGRWHFGTFVSSQTNHTWEIYSNYDHKSGDLGGWNAWGRGR